MGTKSLHLQELGVIYISCLCNILIIRNTNELSGEFCLHLTLSFYFDDDDGKNFQVCMLFCLLVYIKGFIISFV